MARRVVRWWYWLTLDDPIGTPVAAALGLAVAGAIVCVFVA